MTQKAESRQTRSRSVEVLVSVVNCFTAKRRGSSCGISLPKKSVEDLSIRLTDGHEDALDRFSRTDLIVDIASKFPTSCS